MSRQNSMHTTNTRIARSGPVWLLIIAVAVITFLAFDREGSAAPEKTVSIRLISVTGVGANAVAWYDGAPPTGEPVQAALDKFAKQGYRVTRVVDPHVTASPTFAWNVLLERVE